jgi:DNA-binding LacI/PurR family transcriptional regulator
VLSRPKSDKRPNLVEVAALAGVSHITVSRVMHAHPSVRPATKARVEAAMQKLGYEPNPAARMLVTGKSQMIGVVCHNTALYGPAAALIGLEHAAAEHGYFTSMIALETLERDAVERAVSRLRQQAVAGVVLVSPQAAMAEAFDRLPHDVPAVALWGSSGGGIPVIASDEAQAARDATRHLLGLGHRMVWHVAGPAGRIGAGERIQGWRETLREAGAQPPPLLGGDWSARSGYEAGCRLAADREVTAVFAGNDQMALGVIRALHEAGRAVPRDVSVVGFDDIPEAAYFTPPLTTIRQDFGELGRMSMARLIAQMSGDATVPEKVMLSTELIIRGSTAQALTP